MDKASEESIKKFKELMNRAPDKQVKKYGLANDFMHIVLSRLTQINKDLKWLTNKLEISKENIHKKFDGDAPFDLWEMVEICEILDMNLKITTDKVDILKDKYYYQFQQELERE